MKRSYLRVTPGEDSVVPGDVPDTIASLSKLARRRSEPLLRRLNPIHTQPPIRFEFVALSAGENESVEFYYGADDHLDALERRLRSIYPTSYEIERVEIDLVKRLVRPVEFTREEFAQRLKDGRLYHDIEQSADGRSTVSDGGEVAIAGDPKDIEWERQEEAEVPDDDDSTFHDIELASPQLVDADGPLTTLDRPTKTADATILARPPLAEAEPYGVEWWGSAARRKDWMTTLTGFTEGIGRESGPADDNAGYSRFPLTPLVEQLVEAYHPLAFQVVFQRRSDWSRDARRRAGELLDGTDTLLQKILGFESPGSYGRSSRHTSGQSAQQTSRSATPQGTYSPAGKGPSRPTSVDEATRFDQVRANSPKRTFSVNLRLLTLVVDGDESDGLEATLDSLRSVFDLVDGQFYEIDGRRLRSMGNLPGSGQRHARTALDCFTSRLLAAGGRRVALTNRSETRPDLILNGDELANFVIIPPATDIPRPSESVGEPEPDTATFETTDEPTGTPEDTAVERNERVMEGTVGPFPSGPDTLVDRDDEVSHLSMSLEPLVNGKQTDPILVTGPPGSGKTCMAKYTVHEFCQKNPRVGAVYINCWEDHSPFQTLYRILDELDGATEIHRQSTATDVVLERLREYDEQHCVLLLDEVDQLDDEDLLYDLLNLPRFSLLLIVNREADLFDGLDDRLASRLGGCERIRLDRYSAEQLTDILAEQADGEGSVRDIGRLECERIAEAVNGDARVAISTLRIASRRVEEDSSDTISQDIVEQALPEARQEVRRRSIDRLPPHHQVIFRVIEEHDRIAPRDLFEEYGKRVEEPKSNRTVRKYLKELDRDGLITAEGTTRDRRYRCPE